MKTILLTGAAGFIGSHVADLLVGRGDRVVGLDNLNDYYDPARKRALFRASVTAFSPDSRLPQATVAFPGCMASIVARRRLRPCPTRPTSTSGAREDAQVFAPWFFTEHQPG